MASPNFAELLRLEEAALAAQLGAVRAAITHPGEKGRGLEQHSLALLRRLLPAEYGLATGFVACAQCVADGGHRVDLSPQIDVIIYDAVRGAPIVDLGSSQVLPLECVHAVVEVKSSLYGAVHDIYRWSSEVRTLTKRHYLFDPEREVNPHAAAEQSVERIAAAFGGSSRHSVQVVVPREQAIDWMAVRCFVLAFEYGSDTNFSLDAARNRLADAFVDPGHLHAVLVPDTCVLWNERADQDPSRLGIVGGTTESPLAVFRHRLLDALANFPRPTINATMDLRPYFADRAAVE